MRIKTAADENYCARYCKSSNFNLAMKIYEIIYKFIDTRCCIFCDADENYRARYCKSSSFNLAKKIYEIIYKFIYSFADKLKRHNLFLFQRLF